MQKHYDFLLLGGGPASVSAAETLRAEGAKGSILMISEDVYAPYGHTYLSKQFLFGAMPKEKLLIHPEAYYREQAIDVMLRRPCSRCRCAEPAGAYGSRRRHTLRQVANCYRDGANSPDHPGFHASGHLLPAYSDGCRGAEASCQERQARCRPRRQLPRCRDRHIARPDGRSCGADRGKGALALTTCLSRIVRLLQSLLRGARNRTSRE